VTSVPKHVGVIPDGNRRWAKGQGLPTLEGHRRGLQVAQEVALAAFERGVEYFTAYAFSTENWNRAQDEVGYLMDLFYGFVTNEWRKLEDQDVRLRFLGRREGLSDKLLKALDETEARTAGNKAGTVSVCLNYGGQTELADAFRTMVAAGVEPEKVTSELIAKQLYGPDVPPVDLLIRTSGEQRTSGFMMWRTAYAELYFTEKLWPAFTVADLEAALAEFAARQRRYGK
jgi:undecaprenyl diphosphate synthase